MLFLIINIILIGAGATFVFFKNWVGAGAMGLFFLASLGLYIFSKAKTNKKERHLVG